MSSFLFCHPVGIFTQRTTWSVTMLCVKESHTIRVIATCCSQVLEHLFAQEIEAALGSDSDTYVHLPSSSLPPCH